MLRRRSIVYALLSLGAAFLLDARPAATTSALEVVATGIPRALQIAIRESTLLVLAPARHGDAAGELYRVDLAGRLPVDLGGHPHVRIPFIAGLPAALGSLAIEPRTGRLFVGEENGTTIYGVDDGRLSVYAVGLHQLGGGSTIAFDALGHLLVADFIAPGTVAEQSVPPGLEQLSDEDYRGPVVFRLELGRPVPSPRRLDVLAPVFPLAWRGRGSATMLPKLSAIAPLPGGAIAALTSAGEVLRIDASSRVTSYARLAAGQYLRANMLATPDGTLYVSSGYLVARIFRIDPTGRVVTLIHDLHDPEGLALDAADRLYFVESFTGRVLRLGVS